MAEPPNAFDKFITRVRNHPVVSFLILLVAIVTALSGFTNAAENLWGKFRKEQRPNINGVWQAQVSYDWPYAHYTEKFTFKGEGNTLQGTASYLEINKGILEGSVKNGQLAFITKSQEILDNPDNPKENIHRYLGRLTGDSIIFTLQTEGGYSGHVPVEFIAKRTQNSPL
jgi:hypothetical protein